MARTFSVSLMDNHEQEITNYNLLYDLMIGWLDYR